MYEDLKKALRNKCGDMARNIKREADAADMIESQAARIKELEAAQPVRCGECSNWEKQGNSYGYCYLWDHEQGMSPNRTCDDDYCSYGRKRRNNA